jgi:hypothetical protein
VEEELGSVGALSMDSAPIILAVKISARAAEARNVGVCFADAAICDSPDLGQFDVLASHIHGHKTLLHAELDNQ